MLQKSNDRFQHEPWRIAARALRFHENHRCLKPTVAAATTPSRMCMAPSAGRAQTVGSALDCREEAMHRTSITLGLIAALAISTMPALPAAAGDADGVPAVVAAARTAKHQCMNTCRARYRDCRHLDQLPSSECRNVYQDCTRYACTGLGPG